MRFLAKTRCFECAIFSGRTLDLDFRSLSLMTVIKTKEFAGISLQLKKIWKKAKALLKLLSELAFPFESAPQRAMS